MWTDRQTDTPFYEPSSQRSTIKYLVFAMRTDESGTPGNKMFMMFNQSKQDMLVFCEKIALGPPDEIMVLRPKTFVCFR